MLKVTAFTGGIHVPSARFRVRQYIPKLRLENIAIYEMFSRFGAYPPKQKWMRPAWACATLLNQIPNIARSYRHDIVLLQREILSTYLTIEPLVKKPRILDVDDAIYLYRGGHFIRRLAQCCDLVICGNNYLANWFNLWNPNVTVLPTAIDTQKYVPKTHEAHMNRPIIIGWIGTSSNLQYLYNIEMALNRVIESYLNVQLLVICDRVPVFRRLALNRVKFLHWSEQTELENLQTMDIGIMPLEDSPWTRGKCSFKMLQYMSCGLPVVVSPVGMNAEVLAMDNIGMGASTELQWVEALLALLDSTELRSDLGAAGRRTVEKAFSIDVLAPRLASCLRYV